MMQGCISTFFMEGMICIMYDFLVHLCHLLWFYCVIVQPSNYGSLCFIWWRPFRDQNYSTNIKIVLGFVILVVRQSACRLTVLLPFEIRLATHCLFDPISACSV